MGCGICNLDIMACRCSMWDVGCTLQIYGRWGLGGRQFTFNGISTLASCQHVLLMPCIWLKKDIEGTEGLSHVSILAATRYLGQQGVKLYDTQVHRHYTKNTKFLGHPQRP